MDVDPWCGGTYNEPRAAGAFAAGLPKVNLETVMLRGGSDQILRTPPPSRGLGTPPPQVVRIDSVDSLPRPESRDGWGDGNPSPPAPSIGAGHTFIYLDSRSEIPPADASVDLPPNASRAHIPEAPEAPPPLVEPATPAPEAPEVPSTPAETVPATPKQFAAAPETQEVATPVQQPSMPAETQEWAPTQQVTVSLDGNLISPSKANKGNVVISMDGSMLNGASTGLKDGDGGGLPSRIPMPQEPEPPTEPIQANAANKGQLAPVHTQHMDRKHAATEARAKAKFTAVAAPKGEKQVAYMNGYYWKKLSLLTHTFWFCVSAHLDLLINFAFLVGHVLSASSLYNKDEEVLPTEKGWLMSSQCRSTQYVQISWWE